MMTRDSDFDPTAEPFDWEAIARYLAGESAPDEAREVRAWLDARPDRADVVTALGRSFERLAAEDGGDVDVEGALARVHARMAAPTAALTVERGERGAAVPRFAPRLSVARPVWRRPAAWLAAAAAVAIAAVGVSRMERGSAGDSRTVKVALATGIGARDSIRLADGTRVLLGPASKLVVADDYGARRRDVYLLSGEAFFEVVHDTAHPFVVRAAEASIEDIGTAFTVRIDTSTSVRIAVTQGKVRLWRGVSGGPTLDLEAGQAAVLDSGSLMAREQDATADELAFTRGQLVFREAPLTRVASDVERWYGIRLRVDDSTLAKRRLTASFEKETPEQVLAVIGAALGTTVTRQGDFWVVGKPARGRATGTR